MKAILILAPLLFLSTTAQATSREKITPFVYEVLHNSFYESCVGPATEEASEERAKAWCACGADFYVKNIKAIIKKKKMKYVDQIVAVQKQARISEEQGMECLSATKSADEDGTW